MPIEMLRYDITPVGMHYMLTHFDIPDLDADGWRLAVGGQRADAPVPLVGRAARDGADDPPVTLECAGNGRSMLSPRPRNQPWGLEAVGTAEWTGVPLRDVIGPAGVSSPMRSRSCSRARTRAPRTACGTTSRGASAIADARRPEVLLAYAMNGRALEPQHGAPVRLIVPGWYGMASVKWLTAIEAVDEAFQGYQQVRSYNIRQVADDPGERVTRIAVRALDDPARTPGLPDARLASSMPGTSRSARPRVVRRGATSRGSRSRVDGRWSDARLEEPVGRFAWRGWSFDWTAEPGPDRLSCRATDANGRTQPLEQDWNLGGYCNNMVQTVELTVDLRARLAWTTARPSGPGRPRSVRR